MQELLHVAWAHCQTETPVYTLSILELTPAHVSLKADRNSMYNSQYKAYLCATAIYVPSLCKDFFLGNFLLPKHTVKQKHQYTPWASQVKSFMAEGAVFCPCLHELESKKKSTYKTHNQSLVMCQTCYLLTLGMAVFCMQDSMSNLFLTDKVYEHVRSLILFFLPPDASNWKLQK